MANPRCRFSLGLAFVAAVLFPGFVPARPRKTNVITSAGAELEAPAGKRPAHIDRSGVTVIANGRLLTPRGIQVTVAPHPYGMALSPNGKTLVTVNSGTAPFSLSIITRLASAHPRVAQIPRGFKPSGAEPKSVYIGAAIAPDNRTVYVSEGNNGRIGVFDLATRHRIAVMDLDGAFEGVTFRDSLTGDLKLSRDGRTLYALDIAHFRLVIFDTRSCAIVASLPVGYLPFGIALSPDGRAVYVSNAGMFRYSLVPGYDPKNSLATGLTFPPFGFPSKQAEQGVTAEGKRIPGLGLPNTAASNSLWIIDVSNPADPRVTAKIPTGIPVGPGSAGGSSPCGVVASDRYVYVSNASQDSITVIDALRGRVTKTFLLDPAPSVRGLHGVLPFGLALSPHGALLYVACAGINAVAVIEAESGEVLGYIPTGWFPARVALSPDGGTLYVANAKGFGSGPNGGPDFHEGPEGAYIGNITKGTVSIIKLASLADVTPAEAGVQNRGIPASAGMTPPQFGSQSKIALRTQTVRVLRNNGFIPPARNALPEPDFPIPPPGMASREIQYVVYIVKENRTFDQVFGELARVNGQSVNADPGLAEYGNDSCVRNEKMGLAVTHADVTPNHYALARRFGISDNFYVDSDVSVDGHHWLVGNYPNVMFESSWPAGYGGQYDFKPDASAPGRLEIGSTSPWPEDYLEAGSLWEHLARYHITFRNYGESLELPGYDEEREMEPTGVREATNVPLPEPLFQNTSRIYPDFNTNISDQYRFQQFMKEYHSLYESGREPFPHFIYIWLPQDHTAKPAPALDYNYRASYVADNDLALGKFVQVFSHSPYWKHMVIFVTEDDAQSGTDHVDAHRSILLAISPYSRRGVSHAHTDFMSMLKTTELIFGISYLNQYDAAATDLRDRFTSTPDFAPYNALPPDLRIFDPSKVKENGFENSAGLPPSAPLDDPATIERAMAERANRHAAAGCSP